MAATSASPVVSGTTTPSSSSSSAASSAAATSALASSQIAGNFQSFLTLLTTQLQNQNPLDPLDTNQFTQQLVEFAGVQQQLNTNDSLATLVSLQQTAQSTQALGFVGQTVVVNGNTAALTNSSATWDLTVPTSGTLNVTIANSTGQTVYTGSYAVTGSTTAQPFTWNGEGTDGTTYPAGQYTLTATGTDATGGTVAVTTQIQGVVSAVDIAKSPPLLTVNGQTYTVSQIASVASTAN
jgi:flagellar basal-body rod modification protein FlgD